jgi:hypothetical protein
MCPEANILSIEHQSGYAEKARKEHKHPKTEIVQREISLKGGVSTGYVNHALWRNVTENGGKVVPCYDLIFVDGRSRFDCLMTAMQLVKPDGVVMLHDSHRNNYHPAVKAFPYHRHFKEIRTVVMTKEPVEKVLEGIGEIRIPWVESKEPVPRRASGEYTNKVLGHLESADNLLARFESGEPFTYLRFGDADMFFIEDENYGGNRRHDGNPDLSKDLRRSFSIDDPDYLIGCVAGGNVFRSKEKHLQSISSQYHGEYTYYSAASMQILYMKYPEKFIDFLRRAFHGKRVLFIGGNSVAENALVKAAFDVTATINFTDRNAYKMLGPKMPQIEKNISKFDIVVSALGQATRVLGQRLWDQGYRTQYFDVGSVVDALAGRPLRSWIKRVPELRATYQNEFLR